MENKSNRTKQKYSRKQNDEKYGNQVVYLNYCNTLLNHFCDSDIERGRRILLTVHVTWATLTIQRRRNSKSG